MTRFKHLTFNLRQSIIKGGECVKLEHYSLALSTGLLLKHLNLFERLSVINFEEEDVLSNSVTQSLLEGLAREIQRIISLYHNSMIHLIFPDVKFKILFVIEQVIIFIKIYKVYSLDEKHLIIKYLVINQEGTVNTLKSILKLIGRENLSPNRGFILGMTFFMSKILNLYFYKKLSICEKDLHCGKPIETDIARYFWIHYIEGSRKHIKENFLAYYIEGEAVKMCRVDTNEYKYIIQNIFRAASDQNNEMAVQVLWISYISKMNIREILMREIIEGCLLKSTHFNIVMYLIMQATVEELRGFLSKYATEIMILIYNNKRWIDSFFHVFNELKFYIKDYKYFFLLYKITSAYEKKDYSEIDFYFLKKFYNLIPEIKRGMLQNDEMSRKMYYNMLRAPFEFGDLDLVTTFLDDCSEIMVYNFIFTYYGMELIKVSIRKSKYEFVDNFLNEYFNEVQINTVKETFFETRSYELFIEFSYFPVVRMNDFMNWISGSIDNVKVQETISKFPYMSKGKIMREQMFSLIHKNHNPLPHTEKILIWYAGEGNLDEAKSSILLHISAEESSDCEVIKCYEDVSMLVIQSNWIYLGILMKWLRYSIRNKQILGRKLLLDSTLFKEMQKKENVFNYFYDFIDWVIRELFIKEKDDLIRSFKLNIFTSIELFQPFIIKWELDEIKKAIEWCKPPVRKARGFAKTIRYSIEINKPQTVDAQEKFDAFFEWFKSI